LDVNANPDTVFSFIQDLEKQASQINRIPVFQRTGEDMALKNSYQQLADELKTRLFEGRNAAGEVIGPGADQALLSGLATPDQLQALTDIHPQLARDVASAQTVGDLRKIAAPFVKGSQLAHETEMGSQIGFNNVGGAVKGVGKLIQNPLNIAAVPLSSNAVNAGVGSGARTAASILRNVPQPPDWLSMLLGRITGQAGAQVLGNSVKTADAAGGGVTLPDGSMGQSGNPLDTANSYGSAPQDQLRRTLGVIMLSRARSAGDLKDAFALLAPNANLTPLSPQQQQLQGNAQSGLRALGIVKSELARDPNAPLKANIPVLQNQTPYAAAAKEMADVITRLRTGAALNKDEQAFYMSQLPQPFDSPQTIQYKLSLFENLYNKYAYGQVSAPSGPSSIPSPLGY
jgi:hypothetical protein